MADCGFESGVRRRLAFFVEIVFISALILLTRCANYGDVFFGGQISFVDADCYSRMSRAHICFEHPGTIIRRHDFENFPGGTSPHTTAPLDYLIVALATVLAPLSENGLDLAGAIVSPVLSIVLGIFLCWWTRKMHLRYRWGFLILYAASPILAHGFALGRPDHHALLIALITIALCAEWTLARSNHAKTGERRDTLPRVQDTQKRVPPYGGSKSWSIVSGASWALALWVSLYEPLILVVAVVAFRARDMMKRERRIGWIVLAAILGIAFLIERRIPQWPNREFIGTLKNWSTMVGELAHVSLGNSIWFSWCGWLLLLAPILFWPRGKRCTPLFLTALLMTTFALTIWQARWSYFFVMIFAMVVPEILSLLRKPLIAGSIFIIGLFPIAQAWDHLFSDEEVARRAENKIEQDELRALSAQIDGPFLAPWWFCPAISYWSRQAGVGGSSHESIWGTIKTAEFFVTQSAEEIKKSLEQVNVAWLLIYDADRVAENSSRILGRPVPHNASCYLLDRRASEAPPFLRLISQTGHFKLFRVLKS
jgi:asparagine N-glycosylation enzyme membrane subunit Stt3